LFSTAVEREKKAGQARNPDLTLAIFRWKSFKSFPFRSAEEHFLGTGQEGGGLTRAPPPWASAAAPPPQPSLALQDPTIGKVNKFTYRSGRGQLWEKERPFYNQQVGTGAHSGSSPLGQRGRTTAAAITGPASGPRPTCRGSVAGSHLRLIDLYLRLKDFYKSL